MREDKVMNWVFNNFGKIWLTMAGLILVIWLAQIFGIAYLATHADCFGIDTSQGIVRVRTDLCETGTK